MDENKLNHISKKLFENIELEKPPVDFTEKLMLKIEQATNAETVKSKPFFKNKFMLLFIFTFSIIIILSIVFPGSNSEPNAYNLKEKFELPIIDLDILSKYLNIGFDFSFIAKLIVGSIIVLIVFDLISGTLIDRFIDSRARKENKI